MWKLQPEDEYEKGVRKWPKKYRRELLNMQDNLDTFLRALNQGAKLEQIKFGFIHREPRGVLGIDQRGRGKGLKQTRLYTYPNRSTQLVHLITIGDKGSQKADIEHCNQFVDNLTNREEKEHG